jgi:hypothetical protein
VTEVPLGGGRSTDGVVRVGDTVRRPSRFANQLMRDVLVQLEQVGFDATPRWLGLDDQGRDVLTWIEGDDYSDTRDIVFADEQLATSARLLRRYHDALAGSPLAGPCEVVCHGDYGPWNLAMRTASRSTWQTSSNGRTRPPSCDSPSEAGTTHCPSWRPTVGGWRRTEPCLPLARGRAV